jgi:N-acyl-D-aspartate/D-glutamate deacylase
MADRGVIASGTFADLVLLDPAVVDAGNSWTAPTLPSHGIDEVWVNGRHAWTQGASLPARSGRWLDRPLPCLT